MSSPVGYFAMACLAAAALHAAGAEAKPVSKPTAPLATKKHDRPFSKPDASSDVPSRSKLVGLAAPLPARMGPLPKRVGPPKSMFAQIPDKIREWVDIVVMGK